MTKITAAELADRLQLAGEDAQARVIVGAENDPDREAGNAYIAETGHLMVGYDSGARTRLYEDEVELVGDLPELSGVSYPPKF